MILSEKDKDRVTFDNRKGECNLIARQEFERRGRASEKVKKALYKSMAYTGDLGFSFSLDISALLQASLPPDTTTCNLFFKPSMSCLEESNVDCRHPEITWELGWGCYDMLHSCSVLAAADLAVTTASVA